MTIARSWSARATRDGAQAYVRYFRDTLAPELAALPGYLGASIHQGTHDEVVELVVITRWASLDAIRGFAGDDHERAVVEPEARAVLLSFDDRVEHRAIVLEVAGPQR
ncbi:MAG TPA: antibiotic biosynthesis monooxygenase [Kofleriaceae bacterium]|jgi:heme-degrading monooxygenase HmoA|nr:antibiotic biosynthesis monooxygenase [Kofleriaceae bacterium]